MRWPSAAERFLANVLKDAVSGCWIWTGYRQRSGANGRQVYGRFTADGGQVYAHRFSYRKYRGPIPAGLKVLHRCDRGLCVNPEHLFLGTNKDNTADMIRKGRQRVLRGSEVNRATLIEREVAEIKGLLKRKIRRPVIARRYGTTVDILGYIARGQTWRHVKPASTAAIRELLERGLKP